jgi:hypothetical protein
VREANPDQQVSFDYAVVRVVPRVERAEFVNVGVIVFGRTKKFLDARVSIHEERLRAMYSEIDLDEVERHLESICKICGGAGDSGPIGQLPIHERWHWLVAPRSTIIQMSEVHSGLSNDLSTTLESLFEKLVK